MNRSSGLSFGRRGGGLLVLLAVLAIGCSGQLATTKKSLALPTSGAGASASASGLAPAASPTGVANQTINPTASIAPTSSAAPSTRLPGEPDSAMTPGAINPAVTQANIKTTICVSGYTDTIRPPSSYTTALKRTQIVAYGYTDTNLADYEEDHLISLEIGGDPRNPANLWPEPYTALLSNGTPVGARVKDQIENKLHTLVCNGTMPLAQAQTLIRTDWITAWRTYVVGSK